MKILYLTFLLLSCASPDVKPVEPDSNRLEELKSQQRRLIETAIPLLNDHGWLVDDTCDAMMWTSLFGAFADVSIDISAAESETDPGKFYRTTEKTCWVEGREDQRSGSTWSRDMSISFLIYLRSQGDLETIERHIAYGEANGWIMGDGAKSRTVYSPALISLWYKTAKVLGHDYGKLEISNIWTKGLDDYQAHLQTLFIYHLGGLDGAISDTMLARIREHNERLPGSTFYSALRAKYDSGIDAVVNRCISDKRLLGDYVRCHGKPCGLAEQIFACGIVIKHLERRG